MHSRAPAGRQIRSVIITTALFVFVAVLLGWLGASVISHMRDAANVIDDGRAVRAAEAAVKAVEKRLASTVQDNAVWTEAYEAITQGDAKTWAYENWGETSQDYPLYDGVILTAADAEKSIISAYLKGQEFEPLSYLGQGLLQQIERASIVRSVAATSFFRADGETVLVASQAVQPFSENVTDSAYATLSFLKIVTPEVIDTMAADHQLEGLRLETGSPEKLLSIPLNDLQGAEVARLSWPSQQPGAKIFSEVYPTIAASAVVLVLYLVSVLAAGGAETRRLRKMAELAHQKATHDSLSGLHNRFGLLEALNHLLVSGNRPPLVLHLLDLDGFKAVNDAWGHAVGDQLLTLVADRLRTVHGEVTHVARLGGDEFALVQVGQTDPAKIGALVLDIFRSPFLIGGRTIEVGASVGIAVEGAGNGAQDLLHRADLALYEAKGAGRGQAVHYDQQLDRQREEVAALEQDLRQALERDEIQPFFQPLARAATGEVLGVEALARWLTPHRRIGPDEFIALAERCGLIDMLGKQMLRKSIREAKLWPHLNLSVNVSPLQLCNPNFSSEVKALLGDEDFDPRRLTLEITEGVLMSNPDHARRSIDALRAIGVRFALDDFGCGYASIGTLREFGFDRMKIDRSLVTAAHRDRKGLEILRATISLAEALEIPVTAEGIETADQANVVRAAGCDQLQGYMIGRPMPANELNAFLAEQAAA
ncbi:putative bifunctional diguanylate cyclase/phosphodiesterase [Rhizobium terrae]|uniref:putative bifunctional diguanylate cyclase/phosphodiesterase n=1 Tax=Rhizobium terrae TaxID=2171756 RepID=UPI000E3B85AE|nr:EAL domain-containing protein [Rhizobium terrae]